MLNGADAGRADSSQRWAEDFFGDAKYHIGILAPKKQSSACTGLVVDGGFVSYSIEYIV